MTHAPPKLEVVQGGVEPATAPEPSEDETRSRNLLAWLLGGLLVVALLGLVVQGRQAADLQAEVTSLTAEVTSLTAELSATRRHLEAHQAHLGRVRSSIAELQMLADEEPVAEPAGRL